MLSGSRSSPVDFHGEVEFLLDGPFDKFEESVMIVSNIFSQSEKQFHPLSELQFGVDDHVALFLPFWQFVFVALFVEVFADLGVVFEVFLEEDDSFGLGDFVGLQEGENADQDIGS